LFLIKNRNEYPDINEMFNELEIKYGLRPEEIFSAGRTPTLKLKRSETYTMQQYLKYLLYILSGAYTAEELKFKNGTKGITWLGGYKTRLSEKVQNLVEANRKRGSGTRV
jgi:hypothetical protein